MTKWEYKVFASDFSGKSMPMDERLNEFGKEGWELVTIDVNRNPKLGYQIVRLVLKRPLSEPSQ